MNPMYRTMTRILPAFFVLALFLLMAALLLSACTWPSQPPPPTVPGETELAFETIERASDGPRYYTEREPKLILITSRQEIERLDALVSVKALKRLEETDFEQYFAVAIFRGHFATGCCWVTIQRVGRRGDQVVLYAEFGEARGPLTQGAISPYHLVKVRRDSRLLEPQDVILLTWLTYH
jgi:hypothetical protein